MSSAPPRATGGRRRRVAAPPVATVTTVVALDAQRILRALARRSRYKYVTPSLHAEGEGWLVRSPNCSRNIDPAGGEIPIAWFQPQLGQAGRWRLFAHDHASRAWVLQADGLTLAQALAIVCDDSARLYWP